MDKGFKTILAVCVALAAGLGTAQAQRLDSRLDNNSQDAAACHGDDPARAINACTNLIRSAPDMVGGGASADGSPGTNNIISSIATNPVVADATITRALNYLKTKRIDEAITDCTRVIAFLPSNPACYAIRAAALVSKNLEDNALADAEKGVALDPNNAFLLATRGQIYEKIGAKEEAIADYRKAAQIDPNQVSARQGLTRLGAP
jgi:tetratricopeptide (TPR) repeat protein